MSWAFWISTLVIICVIFYVLWRYASKIEVLEEEEQQWIDYLEWMWQNDPYNAPYYQQMFEEKFYK